MVYLFFLVSNDGLAGTAAVRKSYFQEVVPVSL
jgi:hypothetical protein